MPIKLKLLAFWKRVRKAVYLVGGILFIILGILGLFLPILQGILFLLIGLSLLGAVNPRVRRWLAPYRAKLKNHLDKMKKSFHNKEQ